ncbi:hypothetical protein [Streptomyces graminilatus]|uniref:hypothetical protein n=1 Tax=Streptomyces graminilatus TaxID=1464070 RepID=UPI0006E258A7|nr:hypothetical protein [Streptomyces graminilatus]
MSVRLLAAQPADQENLDLPRGGCPWFDLTPVLEENRTMADFRYLDELEEEDPRDVWERHFGVTAEEKWPRFVIAMSWARSLMSWALPHHGRLFHHVSAPTHRARTGKPT